VSCSIPLSATWNIGELVKVRPDTRTRSQLHFLNHPLT
jgi:hypothetical protein